MLKKEGILADSLVSMGTLTSKVSIECVWELLGFFFPSFFHDNTEVFTDFPYVAPNSRSS